MQNALLETNPRDGVDAQDRVRAFEDAHDAVDAEPEYRLLDLAAEVGEFAADACTEPNDGTGDDAVAVKRDEIGDALFSLLSFANAMDVDADTALDEALERDETRIDESGGPGSGD